jgi:hypothetical protein
MYIYQAAGHSQGPAQSFQDIGELTNPISKKETQIDKDSASCLNSCQ